MKDKKKSASRGTAATLFLFFLILILAGGGYYYYTQHLQTPQEPKSIAQVTKTQSTQPKSKQNSDPFDLAETKNPTANETKIEKVAIKENAPTPQNTASGTIIIEPHNHVSYDTVKFGVNSQFFSGRGAGLGDDSIIQAYRDLGATFMRFPGGTFSNYYNFRTCFLYEANKARDGLNYNFA